MPEEPRAKNPFKFSTRLSLSELTGRKAATLPELAALLRDVPGSCIYHHTHRFLQQHQYLSPEPPNDFAYWVSEVLGEDELGERLASIDTVSFPSIRALREKIVATIDDYLRRRPDAARRFARPGEEFHFIKAVSFILPLEGEAWTLSEFADILERVTINSIFYHVFEARLRLERGTNDFSNWIEHSLGNAGLARRLARLDPYTYTMEELRATIVRLVRRETHAPA